MAISLSINGTDRTKAIVLDSLKIENILTRARDTCDFLLAPSEGLTPVLGQEVIILLGATKVFAGVITEIEQSASSYKVIFWKVTCQDYTRLLDRRLVAESYENMTVDAIIADLKATYFPAGFTTNNASCAITIGSAKFNYLPLSKVLEQLANLVGYDWYIDYDKDVHFFSKTTNLAPVDIEDANGSMIFDSLIIRRDNSQVRNSIIVRGGEYQGARFTGEWEGNGTDYTIPLPYRFADFRASLTGESLSLGIDYIGNPDAYHAMYNFQEKVLKFKATDIPTAGAVLRYSGLPYLPVIVKLQNPASISTFSAAEGGDGIYEYLIIDKTIVTKQAARERAAAEITNYATTVSEGEFQTETAGIKAGQRIRINSVSRAINEYFVVNKVTFAQFGNDAFIYHISLVTTKTFDLYDLLSRMATADTKNITIDSNEQVEIVKTFEDTLAVADAMGTFLVDSAPYLWDAANSKWNFSTWS